ncbi:tubulin-specific chaperone A isoform 2-T2 [Cariama cristata]
MADPRLRQIKIKTGVVRRLAKEKVMYEKEAKQQEEKIEKMKAEACDDYGIKKQHHCGTLLVLLPLILIHAFLNPVPVSCRVQSGTSGCPPCCMSTASHHSLQFPEYQLRSSILVLY